MFKSAVRQSTVVDNIRYVGLEGFVTQAGNPPSNLRVYVAGSYWPALSLTSDSLALSDPIRVVGRRGITLIVESAKCLPL